MEVSMKNIYLWILIFFIFPCLTHSQTPAYESQPWFATGGPLGGLGYDIRYSYADYNRWYVTDAWAGFFISEDRGITWRSSNTGITAKKGLDAIPVFCCTVDPHNPSTLWIGTEGTGDIYRSTNHGDSWEPRNNGVEVINNALTFRGFTVHPETSDIVYAMAEIGSAGWTEDGIPLGANNLDRTMGAVYKTENGGEDWTEIWRGNNLARYCWINPQQPETLYVSTGIFDREAADADTTARTPGGVGILKSIDGGANWEVFNKSNGLDDLFVGSLSMHPENPDILLAATGNDSYSKISDPNTGGLFITVNGGELWTKLLPEPGAKHEIMLVVEYSTTDPNIAYAFSQQAAYRSDDGGFTWQRFARERGDWGAPGLVVGFPIDAQCDPDNPMRVIVNSYLGGNMVSEDGGETWMEASQGYTGGLVHHLEVTPDQSHIVFAGSRSGIYKSRNGGDIWEGLVYTPANMPAKFNEIIGVAVDRANPNHILTMPNDFGTILVSNNGGIEWDISTTVGRINILEFAPSGGVRAYTASDLGFFKSDDGGYNFDLVNSDNIGKQITALVIHPEDPNMLWAMTRNAGFVTSSDAGQNWTASGTGLPLIYSENLAVHPLNMDLMYTGIHNEEELGGQGLYRSLDGGQTWSRLDAGLEPNAEIVDVIVDPSNPEIAYCADHLSGVYATTNTGETWFAINEGLDHRTINVLALSADGSVLYAGVEGAGVYRLGTPVLTGIDQSQMSNSLFIRLYSNYPNPFNNETTIRYDLLKDQKIKVDVLNIQGRIVKTLINKKQMMGAYSITWNGKGHLDIEVTSGIYFYRIICEKHSLKRKMVFIK